MDSDCKNHFQCIFKVKIIAKVFTIKIILCIFIVKKNFFQFSYKYCLIALIYYLFHHYQRSFHGVHFHLTIFNSIFSSINLAVAFKDISSHNL